MLTRIRKQSKKILLPIARALIKIKINANTITFVGLILSLIYLIVLVFFKNPILGLVLLLLSGFMDAIDGEVARLSGSAGSKGSFLDSSLDRIEDMNYILGLLGLGFPSLLVGLLIGISITISYLRAKAESLGLKKIEGRGLIERGERIIILFVILLVSIFSVLISLYIAYIFLILSIVTVIQRFIYIYFNLS
ncbi:archaetidylinositol phosphate synthase [Sulfolobus acidocaldarius]|uniref:Archaetidylinositol phosphate synthase n=4 Tax=Sulfolobus acidocaldarius TaxID=2285 RepID=Q4J8M6_SULAC|nr:archaetidylinositol phosphate synthase [Sulfolobus acidocaldarius]AAY80855.1 CDP-alcohol phosphatidyltransferase [Sulfolobus acidocaldarius DSM 639]AGE73728.1 CDP-alcohol phosphatidyltransferase [Sulfolobus acidocaldarius Ron12/I]ALU30310.1 CDP-alcohol phosphatidyltransferase [Sulfolobus acidocaldarius]ALU31028.1 CDP-alcohol phosphatidyltransferase [Sulfolobus acidocaldarius]WCM35366.1 CDP-alcohol phosphatidyltransferase family protein [Sulfolobus acidocaldarius DSM 639]